MNIDGGNSATVQLAASNGCRPNGQELEVREQKRPVKTPAFFRAEMPDREKSARLACASDQGDQEARAARARSVISSTLPVPLMARYLGAAAASALAQLL